MAQLFSLNIPAHAAYPGGSLTCTEPAPKVYLLTLTSPPDNRLTTPVLRALLEALDIIEFGYPHGVVATTSGIPKFYSNGLDLEHAVATDGFWALLYSVWRRFLTYPMPTVALINGHAFAGGLMLAMSQDYRLAPSPRGFVCVNELLFGAPLKPAMSALFRTKVPATTYRHLVLEARRFTGPDAVATGIADGLYEKPEDLLTFVSERDLVSKPKSGIYGVLKAEMYHDLVNYLKTPGLDAHEARFDEAQGLEEERKEFGKVWYEQWLKESKPKL
ncbi:ClpP/crotonase-like domain-containing protein [Dactylonectria macrodidyma]|uniref:ClpP/crotonase-like domain-containing protein n=1 Tax=Dactylonectria macrodidyma TaxID=307937 RepID=A0A9P9F6R4_9HYPO|nr:ClpP/crotonase-like domain-containing protein [Dactylonectria macrodidyma]